MISKVHIDSRHFSKLNKANMPCFKYFINRSAVLGVYREALLMTRDFKDPDIREGMQQMIKDEFEPFRKYRGFT